MASLIFSVCSPNPNLSHSSAKRQHKSQCGEFYVFRNMAIVRFNYQVLGRSFMWLADLVNERFEPGLAEMAFKFIKLISQGADGCFYANELASFRTKTSKYFSITKLWPKLWHFWSSAWLAAAAEATLLKLLPFLPVAPYKKPWNFKSVAHQHQTTSNNSQEHETSLNSDAPSA